MLLVYAPTAYPEPSRWSCNNRSNGKARIEQAPTTSASTNQLSGTNTPRPDDVRNRTSQQHRTAQQQSPYPTTWLTLVPF